MHARFQPQMRRLLTMMRSDPDNPDEVPGVLNPVAARAPYRALLQPAIIYASGSRALSSRAGRSGCGRTNGICARTSRVL